MYGSVINIDSVENAMLDQARDEIGYGRNRLKEYRRKVKRGEVYADTNVPYMGGHDYFSITSALMALAGVARNLSMSKGDLLERLSNLLEKHCDRFERDFRVLYEEQYGQVKALREAKHEERMAEINALLNKTKANTEAIEDIRKSV